MDTYTREVLSKVVACLCQSLSCHSISRQALQVLGDLLRHYIHYISSLTKSFANHANRCSPEISDILMAFENSGVGMSDLKSFLLHVYQSSRFSNVIFPFIEHAGKLNFLSPESDKVAGRAAHIDSHLPEIVLKLVDSEIEAGKENCTDLQEVDRNYVRDVSVSSRDRNSCSLFDPGASGNSALHARLVSGVLSSTLDGVDPSPYLPKPPQHDTSHQTLMTSADSNVEYSIESSEKMPGNQELCEDDDFFDIVKINLKDSVSKHANSSKKSHKSLVRLSKKRKAINIDENDSFRSKGGYSKTKAKKRFKSLSTLKNTYLPVMVLPKARDKGNCHAIEETSDAGVSISRYSSKSSSVSKSRKSLKTGSNKMIKEYERDTKQETRVSPKESEPPNILNFLNNPLIPRTFLDSMGENTNISNIKPCFTSNISNQRNYFDKPNLDTGREHVDSVKKCSVVLSDLHAPRKEALSDSDDSISLSTPRKRVCMVGPTPLERLEMAEREEKKREKAGRKIKKEKKKNRKDKQRSGLQDAIPKLMLRISSNESGQGLVRPRESNCWESLAKVDEKYVANDKAVLNAEKKDIRRPKSEADTKNVLKLGHLTNSSEHKSVPNSSVFSAFLGETQKFKKHLVTTSNAVTAQTVGSYIDGQGNQIWICPACGRQDDGSPMIGCDQCDDWYHWVCIGITEDPGDDQDWFCPRCNVSEAKPLKKLAPVSRKKGNMRKVIK